MSTSLSQGPIFSLSVSSQVPQCLLLREILQASDAKVFRSRFPLIPGSPLLKGLQFPSNPILQTHFLVDQTPPGPLSTQVTISGDSGALSRKGILPEASSQINRFPFFSKSSTLPSPTSASCRLPVGHKGPLPTTQFIHLLPTYSPQLQLSEFRKLSIANNARPFSRSHPVFLRSLPNSRLVPSSFVH